MSSTKGFTIKKINIKRPPHVSFAENVETKIIDYYFYFFK